MKRVIYDFTKCDLSDLEDIYFSVREDTRKRLLGEAVCNWLIWMKEKGAFKNESEFNEIMNTYFPVPEKTEYHAKIYTKQALNLKSPSNTVFNKIKFGVGEIKNTVLKPFTKGGVKV